MVGEDRDVKVLDESIRSAVSGIWLPQAEIALVLASQNFSSTGLNLTAKDVSNNGFVFARDHPLYPEFVLDQVDFLSFTTIPTHACLSLGPYLGCVLESSWQ